MLRFQILNLEFVVGKINGIEMVYTGCPKTVLLFLKCSNGTGSKRLQVILVEE